MEKRGSGFLREEIEEEEEEKEEENEEGVLALLFYLALAAMRD